MLSSPTLCPWCLLVIGPGRTQSKAIYRVSALPAFQSLQGRGGACARAEIARGSRSCTRRGVAWRGVARRVGAPADSSTDCAES